MNTPLSDSGGISSRLKRYRGEKSFKGVQFGRFFLENRFLRVDVHPNGTLSIHDKERGVRYHGLHLFEDGGDARAADRYCPPAHDRKILSRSFPFRLSLIETEPAIRIRVRMKVPVSLTRDRQTRSCRKGLIKIWSKIWLEADSKNLFIETILDNQADDHRVRVLFSTDCDPKNCHVDPSIPVSSDKPSLSRRVTVQDDFRSLSLLTDCLDDYELKLDNRRTLCLTLLRSVGSETQNVHVSLSIRIPETQQRGIHFFRYALCFDPVSI